MTVRVQQLTSWGRASVTRSRVADVAAPEDAVALLGTPPSRGIIARGLGRSYGDACLNDEGDVLRLTAMARRFELDREAATLRCDAGLTYRELVPRVVAEGFLPPVCPGTSFVTMGGAIANDVHGKNQPWAGSFGHHLDWFDLLLPDGTVRRVHADEHDPLFAATLGGVGLTGIVLELQLRLVRIPSNAFVLREERAATLPALMASLEAAAAAGEHGVAWVDALRDPARGVRGVVERARPSAMGVQETPRRALRIPFDMPSLVLQRPALEAFNALYYHRVPAAGRERTVDAGRFLFPLDALIDWNRLYGTDGIYQFQCALPAAHGAEGLMAILREVHRARGSAFLAVLKHTGRHGLGMLSFTMPGWSLALDFRRGAASRALIERLHAMVIERGGRVYLAKDACLRAEDVAAMYPRVGEFLDVLRRVDPTATMQSDMARRLGLLAGRVA